MPLPSPQTIQTMIRSLVSLGGSEACVVVSLESEKPPRWVVVFYPGGLSEEGATEAGRAEAAAGKFLDQALRALVVKARSARGEKIGK